MTKKERVNRNIGLSFDFLRQIVKEPSFLKKISNGSTLEFIEKDFIKKERINANKKRLKRKYLLVKSQLEVI